MAYCTPDDLKALGYTWTDADNGYISTICETASIAVDAYCGQTFKLNTDYQELCVAKLKGGVMMLFPKNLTVSAIKSIAFESFGNIVNSTIENVRWLPKRACAIATATNIPNGEYMVTMTYTFGFADGSYPADLVRATALACAPILDDYFLAQESNVTMVKSIRQGQLRIERGEDAGNIPKMAMAILNGGNNGLGYVRARAAK